MSALDRRISAALEAQRLQGLLRAPPPVSHRRGVQYDLDGRRVIGFCSNDYLGLADHPSFADLATPASGATASRLVCGDLPEHRRLEARLAALTGHEDAVIFPSGFQLNVGVLPALIAHDDRVASDRLNHASLIDGLRLSRASVDIVPHGAPPPSPVPGALSWWVTEALFSMDGDYLSPASLAAHLTAGGLAYVDEAHSFGLFSRDGTPTGVTGHHGLRPTVLVGTFGKALGCAGAFVAASALACRWIRGTARSFVFSTGPSPALTTHIDHALDLLCSTEGDHLRRRLWANVDQFISSLGLRVQPSPIFRIVAGANDTALALSAALLDRGWHVQAIRPPTVPQGTARLRISLTAAHDPSQISAFIADLKDLLDRHGIDPRASP
jgi:8-amino-7-oxononanoate synthase